MKELIAKIGKYNDLCILGFGIEGKSTYKFIREYFPDKSITIRDKNNDIKNDLIFRGDKSNVLFIGENYCTGIEQHDIIIKTPGIPYSIFESHKVHLSQITSQTELFIGAYCGQIIGITGTKGKSTTSSLVSHIIQKQTANTVLVGNIGIPAFDTINNIDKETIIVYELSSHQLEHLRVSPHISVILNLHEEHLDHYKSIEAYQLAKFNIAKYQQEYDYYIFNNDDEKIRKLNSCNELKGRQIPYSLNNKSDNRVYKTCDKLIFIETNDKKISIPINHEFKLKGEHNLLNTMSAVSACSLSGIGENAIIEGLKTFEPLEHRIEYVGNIGGIDFFNDSIATIPEATIAAIKTVNNVETIILGGFDRGINYSGLAEYIAGSKLKNIIFMGPAGIRIKELTKEYDYSGKQMFIVTNMSEAVEISKNYTQKGKACLLSPAASSYDRYSNFAERGKDFKRLILKKEKSED